MKHSGYKVGQTIKAFDFKPMSDRPDSYVEGVITEVGMVQGFMAYTIDVTKDTVYTDYPREVVYVPMEVSFMEYDERVQVVA